MDATITLSDPNNLPMARFAVDRFEEWSRLFPEGAAFIGSVRRDGDTFSIDFRHRGGSSSDATPLTKGSPAQGT